MSVRKRKEFFYSLDCIEISVRRGKETVKIADFKITGNLFYDGLNVLSVLAKILDTVKNARDNEIREVKLTPTWRKGEVTQMVPIRAPQAQQVIPSY